MCGCCLTPKDAFHSALRKYDFLHSRSKKKKGDKKYYLRIEKQANIIVFEIYKSFVKRRPQKDFDRINAKFEYLSVTYNI